MKIIHIILFYLLSINISNAQFSLDSSRIVVLNNLNTIRSKSLSIDDNLNFKAQQYSIKLGNIINSTKGTTYTIQHSTLKYNESICVTKFIHSGVSQLINSIEHKKHILGINNNDTKIGIGIYQFTNPNMSNYYLIVVLTSL